MGTAFPQQTKSGIQFTQYQRNNSKQFSDATERWQSAIQVNQCCGFQYQKTIKKKVNWENRFVLNCEQIQAQFQWAKDMREMVSNCKVPKEKYLKEMNHVKNQAITQTTVDQVLEQEQQVQIFMQNLKKSAVLSLNGSALNNKKSNYSQENKMISTISRTQKKSRFQFDRYRGSAVSSFLQVVLRKSVASLVDDTITQIMGVQKQISKKNARELEVFLKFTMVLQNHLNDVSCILGRIQRLFVLYIEKNYRSIQKSNKNIGSFVDSVKQYLLLIRQSVIDFYSLFIFRQQYSSQNMFLSNEQNILSALTAILFKDSNFYSTIFNFISAYNAQRQSEFMQIINLLKDSPPERFFIKQKFCLNLKTIHSHLSNNKQDNEIPFDVKDVVIQHKSVPYSQCINNLRQLSKTKSPINKMKAIMGCSQNITLQIQKFYHQHCLKRQNWILDADQVLSIFCYIIVNARVQHLHTHLFILQNFATCNQMISMTGYYLSVITCAVQQIKNDYGSDMRPSKQQL